MIATILPGSADFHAVGYNEHKVYKGVATLLEMQNFGVTVTAEENTASEPMPQAAVTVTAGTAQVVLKVDQKGAAIPPPILPT